MVLSTLPQAPASRPPVLNLPNLLTLSRLVLSAVLFTLLATNWLTTGLVLFVIVATTDWLDGYLARKRGETTTLGRILDPFVDKVVVIGSFIFLLGIAGSGLEPWMVTVMVARELLVTGLRSYLEGESVAFGADWGGKIKMIVQCVAIGLVLFNLGVLQSRAASWGPVAVEWGGKISMVAIWTAVIITTLSGISYAWRAGRLIRERVRE